MTDSLSQERKQIAIGLIWRAGSNLLVGLRPEGVPLAGYSEFPGGKVKSGEDSVHAVEREIFEETGLRILVTRLRLTQDYDYPYGSVRLHFFDCELAEAKGDWVPAPWRWVPALELAELSFPPANRSVIESILSDLRP